MFRKRVTMLSACLFAVAAASASAQIERFIPRQGGEREVWRVTHNPALRDWANYHNAQCFSHDGRYICYASGGAYGAGPPSRVFVCDLHTGEKREIGLGKNPRFGHRNHWLFWIGPERCVFWLDLATGKRVPLARGIDQIGGSDYQDRFLFAGDYKDGRKGYRIPIREGAEREKLEGLLGIQWMPNPAHPLVFVRYDWPGEPQDETYWLMKSTRRWFDLDGGNIRAASPQIQRCHQSWSGDGQWHLHGGQLMAGRRWDEPFPSNLHYLANASCGDISPCGRSGRWVVGSGNWSQLTVADLRCGDVSMTLPAALSWIHDSKNYEYARSSAYHDNDQKGSPDGTKTCFVTNYDLKNGPVTTITRGASERTADRLEVASTDGFPDSGRLSLGTKGGEIIGYKHKTAMAFEGLARRMHGTRSASLSARKFVTSFEHRLIPEDKRGEAPASRLFTSSKFKDRGSPLIWQNRTDVYMLVLRQPDPPRLRGRTESAELIPGENHWETFGYRAYRNGKRLPNPPVRPGGTFEADKAGEYAFTAVEWSGLESEPSNVLKLKAGEKVRVLAEKPEDLDWFEDRWFVDGRPVKPATARPAEKAVREIVHLLEGVAHREWYEKGVIVRRYDLNRDGKATRRLYYEKDRLARREYYTAGGEHVSTEIFDADGYITESTLYRNDRGEKRAENRFWYDGGMPVKFVGRSNRHATDLGGPGTYENRNGRWVKVGDKSTP